MQLKLVIKIIGGFPHFRMCSPSNPLFGLYSELSASVYQYVFNHIQYLPPNDLRDINERRVLSLVKRVRQTIPYYGNLLSGVESIRDFSEIPAMTKEEIRATYEEGTATNVNLKEYAIKQHTSGSTGIPFHFFLDRNMQARRVGFYRYILQSVGKTGEDAILLLMGDPLLLLESEYFFFKCQVAEDVDKNITEMSGKFSRKSAIIQSRTSHLIRLAQLVEERGLEFNFRAAIAISEELNVEVRDYLQRVFRAPVYSFYGCSEVTAIGMECEVRDGFHVNIGNNYVEIVDQNHKPVFGEDVGDIVVTSLENEVMPFIRYQTGDRGHWVKGPCHCGRTLPRIRIEGRKVGLFYLPNRRIGYAWKVLSFITARISKIYKYQVIRSSMSEFEIKIVPAKNFTDEDLAYIKGKIEEYLGSSVKLIITIVKDIPQTSGGKPQPFINKAPDLSLLYPV